MKKVIGFNQKIKLNYLEFSAFYIKNHNNNSLGEALEKYLAKEIKGQNRRKKAINILKKIWSPQRGALRDEALEMIPELPAKERLAVYWGMLLLTYPFFYEVVKTVGNVLKLQSDFASSQIMRKIKAIFGERRPVEVAVSEVIGTLKDWRVIEMVSKPKGLYVPSPKIQLISKQLSLWLMKIILQCSEAEMIPFSLLTNDPCLFPFAYEVSLYDMENSSGFEIVRQGGDMVLVGRKSSGQSKDL
jgi:hypothetical protein